LNFSDAIDPASLQAGDLLVNGAPADGVTLSAAHTSATFTFSYQLAMIPYHSEVAGPVEADGPFDYLRVLRQPVAAPSQLGPQRHQVPPVAVGHRLPDQRPQVFRGLQLRRAWWQRVQPDVGRH